MKGGAIRTALVLLRTHCGPKAHKRLMTRACLASPRSQSGRVGYQVPPRIEYFGVGVVGGLVRGRGLNSGARFGDGSRGAGRRSGHGEDDDGAEGKEGRIIHPGKGIPGERIGTGGSDGRIVIHSVVGRSRRRTAEKEHRGVSDSHRDVAACASNPSVVDSPGGHDGRPPDRKARACAWTTYIRGAVPPDRAGPCFSP